MPNPALIDAADLVSWSDRVDAPGRLPEIVRRLVLESGARVNRIEMRASEGVRLGGWDGIVVADPHALDPFVPAGTSAWEMSAERDFKGKANQEYAKRTQNPRGERPSRTVFVFVTSRRWDSKDDWVKARLAEGIWKDVRAYDVDNLAAWLESTPAVHLWASTIAGKDPDGMRSFEAQWESWADVTCTPISPQLMIAGRAEAATRVQQWLKGPASTLFVQGDSPEEAVAFLIASVLALPENEQGPMLARGIVVLSPSVLERVIRSKRQLVLVTPNDVSNVPLPSEASHHLFVPLGREASRTTAAIVLPRVRRELAREALIQMGVPDERARSLASIARRSILSLRRHMSADPELVRPDWATAERVYEVLPAILAGTWDERSRGDIAALEAISGEKYEDLSRRFHAWWQRSDPPFRRVGSTWIVVSKEDAWALVRRFIRPSDVERFECAVMSVLTAPDPALKLPHDRQWMARALDHGRPHSDELRSGLADTLALMGARADQGRLSDGTSPGDVAQSVVRQVLAAASRDATGELWISIADALPQLAEAAPEAFLDALESDLNSSAPLSLSLFQDESDKSFPFPRSSHPRLLWALELLAWSPDHLSSSTRALARLARLEPGGELGNRPTRSLREIFLPWHPQTAAPLAQRLVVLDVLRRDEPAVAWNLVLSLLPRNMDHANYTHSPAWRDWKPETEKRVSDAEIEEAARNSVERLLADVGGDHARWRDLIRTIENLPSALRDDIINALQSLDVSALDDAACAAIWNELREVAQRHRFSTTASWVMPEQDTRSIESAMERFTPPDPALRHAWLFSSGPTLLGFPGDDLQDRERALMDARINAACEMLGSRGERQFEATLGNLDRPEELGRATAAGNLSPESEPRWLREMYASEDPAARRFIHGYAFEAFREKGWDWAEPILRVDAPTWNSRTQAEFLQSLRVEPKTWDWAEQFGVETTAAYWKGIQPIMFVEASQCERAARRLLEVGRAHAAVVLLAYQRDKEKHAPFEPLVFEALETAARTPPAEQIDWGMFTFHVSGLLDYLEASNVIGSERLATLEWSYLPLLRFERRKPRVLHRFLSESPGFFAEVVSAVFPGEGEPAIAVDESTRLRAEHGYELLRSWTRVPGSRDDGSVDPDTLQRWVREARELLSTQRRTVPGMFQIGRVLRYIPNGADGHWPDHAVREILEVAVNSDLEDGLEHEVYASRGVWSRGILDGGDQERVISRTYSVAAEAMRDRWPRAAALCRRVAARYGSDANRVDLEAEKREDLYS